MTEKGVQYATTGGELEARAGEKVEIRKKRLKAAGRKASFIARFLLFTFFLIFKIHMYVQVHATVCM